MSCVKFVSLPWLLCVHPHSLLILLMYSFTAGGSELAYRAVAPNDGTLNGSVRTPHSSTGSMLLVAGIKFSTSAVAAIRGADAGEIRTDWDPLRDAVLGLAIVDVLIRY